MHLVLSLPFHLFSCLRFSSHLLFISPGYFSSPFLLTLPAIILPAEAPFLLFTQHFSSLPLNFSTRATHNFAINFMQRISTEYREQTAFATPTPTHYHRSFFSWVSWKVEVCVVKFRFLTYLTFFNNPAELTTMRIFSG